MCQAVTGCAAISCMGITARRVPEEQGVGSRQPDAAPSQGCTFSGSLRATASFPPRSTGETPGHLQGLSTAASALNCLRTAAPAGATGPVCGSSARSPGAACNGYVSAMLPPIILTHAVSCSVCSRVQGWQRGEAGEASWWHALDAAVNCVALTRRTACRDLCVGSLSDAVCLARNRS